jgi:hypothetical protein
MTRRITIVGLLGMLAACGGGSGPSSPTPTLSLAGTWTGSWQFVASGASIVDTVTATLTQTGATVSGTWTSESGATGQFTNLAAQSATTGSLTISQPTLSGTTCSATTSISGTASAASLELTVPQIAPSGICQWGSSMQFSLKK